MNQSLFKYFYKYAFFMAFPILLVLWQNVSLIFFVIILVKMKNKTLYLSSPHWIQKLVILFALGAVISVINENGVESGFARGLSVLPNYVYWSILVIFITNIKYSLNLDEISENITNGLIISIVFYHLAPYIPKVPGFINSFSPNSFAFLCICFTAPALTSLIQKKSTLRAVLFFVMVLFTLLIESRRAGFVLVLISGMLSINFISFNLRKLMRGSLVLIFLFSVLQINIVGNIILSASPRVHEFLYESENLQGEDRSLLTRRLMVEKSLLIYNDHPLTGVGLNNFSNFDVGFQGDFEGGHYVVNKAGMNDKSAHNSYASILGEGGLLMFIPFIMLILYNLYHFIRYFNERTAMINAYYWAFISACIHMYFVSAILNVYTWFLIGIVTAHSIRSKII